MSNTGSRIDWGDSGKFQRLSRKVSGGSFSSLLSRDGSPRSGKAPGAATRRGQSVVRGGGQVGQKTIAGLSGLKKTLVDRKVNTAYAKNMTKTSGGGHPSRSIVQAKPNAVKVRPEC